MKLSEIMNDEGIMDGIMLWVGAVIVIVIMLPVINGVLTATPLITGGALNTTQQNVITGVGNSYNIVAIIPTIVAAIVILGVVALLGMRRK